MKIKLNKSQVAEIVAAAGNIVPRKSGLPVLGHLKIACADESRVSLTATDLEQTLVMNIQPEKLDCSGSDASFLFPLEELRNVKKTMKKADVITLETAKDDGVSLIHSTATGDLARFVPSITADEFPTTPPSGELEECDLATFVTAFRNVAFSTSTDTTRIALAGVYADPEKSVLVGTDGRRMTTQKIERAPLKSEIIIPVTKTMMKTIPDSGVGRVGIIDDENAGTFEIQTDTMRYMAKSVPGTFPNYEQVTPKNIAEFGTSFQLTEADCDALKTLLPHLKGDSNRPLFVSGNGSRAAIGMVSDDSGACVIALPECSFDGGEAITFCVNGELLAQALMHGFRNIRMLNAETPLYFRDGDDGTHLLMPLRYDVPEALDLEFNKTFDSLPEAVKEPEPAPARVQPESKPETTQKPELQKENETMTEQTQPTPKNNGLTIVESADPVERLEALANTAVEAVKEANAAVRELKKQARVVKSVYRDRDRALSAREKDMQKSLTLLNRLQETIAA